ncbi:MAG: AbrB/MazE/SpoVT family DNA-binding domain-containing protein [Salinarimonas sp.]
MQVETWGNCLAIRLPADLVRELGLKEGDRVALHADGGGLAVKREPRPEEALESLHRFRGRLRLSRDDANAR